MRNQSWICKRSTPLLITLYILTSAIDLHPGATLQRIQTKKDGWSTYSQILSRSGSRQETMAHPRSIKNNLATLNHLYTQQNYFDECKEKDIVPKGLLLQKTCALNCDHNASREWQTTLWNASRQLRDIISSEITHKIATTKETVQQSKTELYQDTDPRTYHETLNAINGALSKQTATERKQKQRKIRRDTNICQEIKASIQNYSPAYPTIGLNMNQPRKQKNRRYNKKAYTRRKRINRKANEIDLNNNETESINVDSENEENNTLVVNLSDYELTPAEVSLLSRGMTFCPNPPNIDPAQIQRDFREFERKLKLKIFFSKENQTQDSQDSQSSNASQSSEDNTEDNLIESETKRRFRFRSNWNPPVHNARLDVFLEDVKRDIETKIDHYEQNKHTDNLTKAERQALKNLRKNTNIVIKPADKGSSVVIMSTANYIAEGERQLSDTKTYKLLDHDPTHTYLAQVNEAISPLNIDRKLKGALTPPQPTCPNLYFLPKIHKENNPGRPIVSGCACPTVEISRFLDIHLRPLVENLPSYIQDTTHFINHIQTINTKLAPLSPRTILVTADVCSLYTNIPHNEGILATKHALDTRTNPHPPTDQLIRLLELILNLNSFNFQGKIYNQIRGTAMGTPCAPSYANLFMGQLEHKLIFSKSTTNIPAGTWKRFIDDIQFLWVGSPRTLSHFQTSLNQSHPSIKFTFETSETEVTFLDTYILLHNGRLHTEIFTKPTDSHAYLLPTSCHPKHTFRSIPYSQALRVRRICSNPEDESHHLNELRSHFKERNYDPKITEDAITRAREKPRSELLTYRKRTKNQRPTFTVTYNKATSQIPHIIHSHLPTLQTSPSLQTVFSEPPLTSFRRPRSLRDILVNAKDPAEPTSSQNKNKDNNSPTGFFKCKSKKCVLHQHITETHTFTSTVTKRTFHITDYMDCKSDWIIYLITCKSCHKQYVGKTETTLYTRLNNTRSEIRNFNTTQSKQLPYTTHFNLPGHDLSCVEITAIETIKTRTRPIILRRESYWIAKLKTLTPNGINVDPGY